MTIELDPQVVEAFADRVVATMNEGSIAFLISIAYQTNLFETMTTMSAATSAQLAEAAGLNERYVREVLGGLTTGKIINYAPETGTYSLPPEHAALLTRAAGPDNLARLAQYLAIFGEVEQQIIECVRKGGGLGYEKFPRFHKIMAEESAAVLDAALLEVILPLVPGLAERLAAGIDVADIGCGSGHAVNLMAAANPASRFTGYDFSPEPLAVARAEAAELQLDNVEFIELDVATLDRPEQFDLITVFDAIHDQAQPAVVLRNICTALRGDGAFLMVDIKASSKLEENVDLPWASLLYTISTMHCMTVSLAHGGVGLGTVWGEQLAVAMLKEAGFSSVQRKEVESDPFNTYFVAHKEASAQAAA